ncbi:glycogen synthase [Chitiniphilus shinanonensis]|uniref:Glycogen synthase n=1 Tax=Chitiniphilus shinanonensis TaxID=553088 RepID=A0ABQ6BVA3_9NEIS|nr:glycogen synthase GlgA [Chitiniphilus shinanonensis]GLS05281.1 glycogen synthase [Chitiniphilus shinanonensis]
MSLHVLMVAAEAVPLAKTGGLGDMVGAFAPALHRAGTAVTLMLPAWPGTLEAVEDVREVARFDDLPGGPASLLAATLPGVGLPLLLWRNDALLVREGSLYLDHDGREYADNPLRFGAFCHAAAHVAAGLPGLPGVDVVHAHDWHTGLVPLLVRDSGAPVRTLFTVHNLAFQGNYPLEWMDKLAIPAQARGSEGCEFWGQLSFVKAGLVYADLLNTVSPGHAGELLTAEGGHGMDGVLRPRAAQLHGILNGIDTALWNPADDALLPKPFSAADPSGKHACKAALQRRFGLPEDAFAPVVALGSRLTHQKMADVALEALPFLLNRYPRLQVAMLGCGQPQYEQGFRELQQRYPRRVAAHIGYSEALAHLLHGGANLLLHGSRFEPCGLAPLYAMRYGTIPVASRVGGLADTIVDPVEHDPQTARANGFLFDGDAPAEMVEAVERALAAFSQPRVWRQLQRNAMQADFGWPRPVERYLALYAQLDQPRPRAARQAIA